MKNRSDDYKAGYSAGFLTGKRHQKTELDRWSAVFEQNKEMRALLQRVSRFDVDGKSAEHVANMGVQAAIEARRILTQ